MTTVAPTARAAAERMYATTRAPRLARGVPVRALGTRARCVPVITRTGGHSWSRWSLETPGDLRLDAVTCTDGTSEPHFRKPMLYPLSYEGLVFVGAGQRVLLAFGFEGGVRFQPAACPFLA